MRPILFFKMRSEYAEYHKIPNYSHLSLRTIVHFWGLFWLDIVV